MAFLSFAEASSQAIRGALCTLLAVDDAFAGLVERATRRDTTPFNTSRGLRRLICNNDPDDDKADIPPLFTGGQCPGTLYSVCGNFRLNGVDSGVVCVPRNLVGPVSIVQIPFSPGSSLKNLRVTDATGFTTLFGNGFDSINSLDVDPISGPDNCGDPRPDFPPYVPAPINVNYNYGDNNEFNVSGTVVISPVFVSLDGTVNANVNLDLGGVNLNGTIELAPNFNVDLFPNGLTGGGGQIDAPLLEPDPTLDGDDSEDDPRETIIGAVVTASRDGRSRATALPQGSSGALLVPRIGTVRFLIRVGGQTFWTEDSPVKGVRQIIPCPWPGGAIAIDATPDVGFDFSVSAVRGKPLLDEE